MPALLAVETSSILDGKADSGGNTILESNANKVIKFIPDRIASTALTIDQTGTDSTRLIYGDGTAVRGHLDILGATTDGNDDGYIIIGPGGANSLERGAAIVMYGNETTGGNEGDLKLDCGNVSGGEVEIITPETLGNSSTYRRRFYWPAHSGDFLGDPDYGGDVVFQKDGSGIQDSTDAPAAAGADQSTATQLVARVAFVTGASGTNGVKFPATPDTGDSWRVYNASASALLVYPNTGDAINSNASNASVSVAAGGVLNCHAQSASQWRCGEEANP